ncbi:MAG: phosphogluconate dehydrogenase (NADP(+)-dependent, decarboxylating) [Candidatus Terraquivivens tikiterensis]|uniref:Phosphogluconate dehydrogenase (NADP(+)-dependent, decarboxylating) n=1 Tax=Candidatus Terraquivivens tikiterensis TaxID=1980982 RepID=A0A2R7Y6A9_9ARCH|nr:MAG: phosphogluconate dehydrogenase (NADP(+)-dependent, decarboxylating) [Candidatus Terraquivivens tikiterensis]
MQKSDVGIIGLATMGANLALNIESKGFTVSVYNRTADRTRLFVEQRARGKNIHAYFSLEDFVKSLDKPRRVILMVKAGEAVDEFSEQLATWLEPGDVIVDGGNSHFMDTERRVKTFGERGIHFMGVGISGGEEGALKGPCIMSGGPPEAEECMRPIFLKIAAKVEGDACYGYMGPGGAGHFVKMVHNGIEYAIMQAIAEVYDIFTTLLGLGAAAISEIFAEWNAGELNSFLLEIASEVLAKVDDETGRPLVELIQDKAGQKGTGKWTSQVAMDLGVPIPTIDAAVSARNVSALKEERVMLSRIVKCSMEEGGVDGSFLKSIARPSLYCTMLTAFAQGMSLISAASRKFGYATSLEEVARIWRGGCIIRARLLEMIRGIYSRKPSLTNLILDGSYAKELSDRHTEWRHFVSTAKVHGIPCPAISSALDYFDSLRRERLPANLIQALRDRFGAHGYERVDKPGTFHTEWRA